MWKYLFKPYYSFFELLALSYIAMIMLTVSWLIGVALVPAVILTQILILNKIQKRESNKQKQGIVV